MPKHSPTWYDDQYNNRARVAEHPAILKGWADDSAKAREQLAASSGAVLDVSYGADATETLDIFPAVQSSKSARAPVLVFIHGGYWRALDKRDASFVAPPFVAAGALVVVVNYALCPAVSIEQICLQMAKSLAWTYQNAAEYGGDPARIVVAGHSAGGHLAAMMLACNWPTVEAGLPTDLVKSALSISGVFDLEPLRQTPFLAADLMLTPESARKLSPALMPAPAGALVALVGGDETPEFLRQNALIEKAWGAKVVIGCEHVTGFNHMSVLAELARPQSAVYRWALRLLEL